MAGCGRNVSNSRGPFPARLAPSGKGIPFNKNIIASISVFVKAIRYRQNLRDRVSCLLRRWPGADAIGMSGRIIAV
jgi:hypothetical protein